MFRRLFHPGLIFLLFLSDVFRCGAQVLLEPQSEALLLTEWVEVLGTEALNEFELSPDDTDRAEYWYGACTAYQWQLNYRFELRNGLQSPLVICSNHNETTPRQDIVANAVRAALADGDYPYNEDDYATPGKFLKTLFNSAELYSCYLLQMYPSVAAMIQDPFNVNGLRVQPQMFQMKLQFDTILRIKAIYELIVEASDSDNEGDGEGDSESTAAFDADDLVVELNLVLCPGVGAELVGGTLSTTEVIVGLTEYILEVNPDTNRAQIVDDLFWTNAEARAEYDIPGNPDYTPSRAEFWADAVSDGIAATQNCRDVILNSDIFNVTYIEPPCDDDCTSYLLIEMNVDPDLSDGLTIEERCAVSVIAGLGLHPYVCSASIGEPEQTQNEFSRVLTQTGIIGQTPWYDQGIDGTGQVVAVSDTGIDTNNCYFWDRQNELVKNGAIDLSQRKVIQYDVYVDDTDSEVGHGTHVCGTVAGKRSLNGFEQSDGVADGIAPGAKLAFVDVGSASSLRIPPVRRLLTTGSPYAKIHSASWGSININYYGSRALQFDEFLYANPEFLVTAAAGNQGRDNSFATVIDPATAKNVLSVGAAQSFDTSLGPNRGPNYVAPFSSKGPVLDGRTKPDVIGIGQAVLSAAARPFEEGACDPPNGELPSFGGNLDGVAYMSGTSMATPGIAGTAALVRQYLADGYYPSGRKNPDDAMPNPTGPLIKAILCNGGQDLTGVDNGNSIFPAGPYDNVQNFGRVSLIDSLYLVDKSNVQTMLWDRLKIPDDGEVDEYSITIDKSGGCKNDEFSATLAWYDPPPALPACTKCVLNDLDLYVDYKGNGTTTRYFPNGKGRADDVNNVERVRISGVQDGDEIVVFVKSTNLDINDPKAALVATGCFGGTGNSLDVDVSVFEQGDNNSSFFDDLSTTAFIFFGVGAVVAVCLACCVVMCVCRKGN